jgi:glycosyltransferase involved in cell wall biosynthesis
MHIYHLADTWAWFGRHTGYHQLTEHLLRLALGNSFPEPMGDGRSISTICNMHHPWTWLLRPKLRLSEIRFRIRLGTRPESLFHVLYYGCHSKLFSAWKKAPRNLITTIHIPAFAKEVPILPDRDDNLRRLSSAIVLYSKDLEFFENLIGKNQVRYIPHGVDVDYFKPAASIPAGNPRLFFTGRHGRDFSMLQAVVERLTELVPEVRFDFLVPGEKAPHLRKRLNHPSITWHERLSDDALLSLYRSSYLLLLPMTFAAANNSVLEALACGLPVVTTDVSGIRDYGGDRIFPLVDPGNVEGMVDLVQRYLEDPHWREEVGTACRRFAECHLNWPDVARKHLQAYRELAGE